MLSIFEAAKVNNDFLSYFIKKNENLFFDIFLFFKKTKYLNLKNIKTLIEDNLAKKIKKKYNYLIGFNKETNKINLINTQNGSVVIIDYNFTEWFKNKDFNISQISIVNEAICIENSSFLLKGKEESLHIDFDSKNIYLHKHRNMSIIYDEMPYYIPQSGLYSRNVILPRSTYVASPVSRKNIYEGSIEEKFVKEHFLTICDCILTKNKMNIEEIVNINNLMYDSNYVLDYINKSFFEIVKWDS